MKALLFLFAITGFFFASAREKKLILHANGKVQYEYEMEGFMLDGRFSCYYETGKLKVKGQFSKNKKTGLWRVWDEKGLLRSERMYTSNLDFEIISQSDSTGARIKQVTESASDDNAGNPLFMHRFLHHISKAPTANHELFDQNGIVEKAILKIQEGKLAAYTDDRLSTPLNIAGTLCYTAQDIVAIKMKEEYACFGGDEPAMVNKLLSVCLVINDKGNEKEMGWIYAADLWKLDNADGQLSKIRDHQYASRITKTTIDDRSFKLRDVSSNEVDKLRLMLIEFEAAAILYVIDQQSVAAN
jgi:hypothetical protein